MVKRTLQEIANFFDMAVARDLSKKWYLHELQPYTDETRSLWISDGEVIELDFDFDDYSGDWRKSLTLPDSWPKEPKFKDGEIVVSKHYFDVRPWSPATMDESRYRRPTKAEWKVLKGEE